MIDVRRGSVTKRWEWTLGIPLILVIVGVVLFSVAVAAWAWTQLSYNSYYNGVIANERHAAVTLGKAAEIIMTSALPAPEKKNQLKHLFANTGAEVRVNLVSSGEAIFFKASSRKGYLRELEYTKDIRDTNNQHYQFNYAYDNRPPLYVGLWRAVTVSLSDYFEGSLSFAEWVRVFQQRRLWERSANFYLVFFPVLAACMLVFRIKQTDAQRSREAIKIAAEEKRRMERELLARERFQLVHKKIMGDVYHAVQDGSRQELTKLSLDWKTMMETSMSSERHDLRNKMGESDWGVFEQNLYSKVIKPSVEKVLEHLNSSVAKLDYIVFDLSVLEIIRTINQLHETELAGKKWLTTDFATRIPESPNKYFAFVNLQRLESIIINLWDNSLRALEEKRYLGMSEEFDEQGREHEAYMINTLVEIVSENESVKMLQVTVQDNGGGFPPDVLNNIYRTAVASAKGNRKGEGTMYISYFIELMGGTVTASNISLPNGQVGASSELRIPIHVGEGMVKDSEIEHSDS